jgi:mannose-6-phosphate isomerase-like protein (cupin superfamily)
MFSHPQTEKEIKSFAETMAAMSCADQVDNAPAGTTGTGLPLLAGWFSTPPQLICNNKGELIRIDFLVVRTQGCTVRLHFWTTLGDMDRDPHTHPWKFKSYILSGGYTNVRTLEDGTTEETVVRVGDTIECPAGAYHQVKDILPGTRTMIVTDEAAPGNAWGYLTDGEHVPFQDSKFTDGFLAEFRKMNWFLPLLK